MLLLPNTASLPRPTLRCGGQCCVALQMPDNCVQPLHLDRVTARGLQVHDKLARPQSFICRQAADEADEDPHIECRVGYLRWRQGTVVPVAHPVFLREAQPEPCCNMARKRLLARQRVLQFQKGPHGRDGAVVGKQLV